MNHAWGLILAIIAPSLEAGAPPPYCPALKRDLSWDPFGIYPLDAERPLTKAGVQIVKDLQEAELGRAESLARYRLTVDKEDLVPAWALGQILRARHAGLVEYRRLGERGIDAPGTLPVLLYRLHVCRVAQNELLSARSIDQELWKHLSEQMKSLRDRCRSETSTRLGLAIGLTQVDVFWAVENRAILEGYRQANPKGVDIRPLLCQAYNTGVRASPILVEGKKVQLAFPDASKPEKVAEIAGTMLKDRSYEALAHYFTARSQFQLDHADLAAKEFSLALGTGKLPPVFEQAARRFLAKPTRAAFVTKIVY